MYVESVRTPVGYTFLLLLYICWCSVTAFYFMLQLKQWLKTTLLLFWADTLSNVYLILLKMYTPFVHLGL
jgi:hypothetical protein